MDALLRGLEEDLGRYVDSLLRGSAESSDVVQEIFLTIVRKLGTIRDPELFRPWVFRVASREAFRALRAEREWRSLLDEGTAPDDVAGNVDLEERLAGIDLLDRIGRISVASRAVISMRYLQGLSQDQIATALGISTGTVKSRIAYGLKQLREAMAG